MIVGHDEMIVDNFAGGGGASVGIQMATGRAPDLAINHDPEALALYRANHPNTRTIGMRMLTPRELFTATGLPRDYKIDPIFKGKPLTKTSQVRMCGNAVPPHFSAAIVGAQRMMTVEVGT